MATDGEMDWASLAEQRVLEAAVKLAVGRRWDEALCRAAVLASGLSAADGALLLPKGPGDLAALLFQRHDAAALAILADIDVASLKVRSRLETAVMARIDAAMADEPAVRAASVFLATPFNLSLAAALGWKTADRLWRWAGDTATDENHYSKRAILSAVLLSTMAVRLMGERSSAQAHLKARIEAVMRFEVWKSTLPNGGEFLGGLARRLGAFRPAPAKTEGEPAG